MLQGGCSIIGKPRRIFVVAFAFEISFYLCFLKIFAPFSVQSRPWRCPHSGGSISCFFGHDYVS